MLCQTLNPKPYNLVDKDTSVVYHIPVRDNEWPRVAGVRRGPHDMEPIRATGQSADLFASLDRFLKEKRLSLKQVFDEFDADRSGALDTRELDVFLRRIMPDVTKTQERLFQVMLDVNGDGSVAYDELVAIIKVGMCNRL